jgi:hypothetical protein
VISWFQAFAFKWVNLCRYVQGQPANVEVAKQKVLELLASRPPPPAAMQQQNAAPGGYPPPAHYGGGLYKFNTVEPLTLNSKL